MRLVHLVPLLLIATAACDGGDTDDTMDLPEDWNASRDATTDGGTYKLSYVPSTEPVPMSEEFHLIVTLTDSTGSPVTGAGLVVDATMPAHGHGMNTTPVATEGEGGSWTISPMLFHMPMHWRITAEVSEGESSEIAHWDVMCCD